MEKEKNIALGNFLIAPGVFDSIVALATEEVEGIAIYTGGIIAKITERMGRKSFLKGIRTKVEDRKISAELSIVVEYGYNIKEKALEAQRNIYQALQSMVGLDIDRINITVVGVMAP